MAGITTAATFLLWGLFAKDMSDPVLFVICTVQGLGWGFVGGPMASRLVESAGDQRDMASALINEAFYIGGAIGTALMAMIFAVCSGTDGTPIGDLTPDVFVQGFVPAMLVCAAIGAAIAVLSAVVKDGDSELRGRLLHELGGIDGETLVETGTDVAVGVVDPDLEPDACAVHLGHLHPAENLGTDRGGGDVGNIHEGADGGLLPQLFRDASHGGLLDHEDHAGRRKYRKGPAPPSFSGVLFCHGDPGFGRHAGFYHGPPHGAGIIWIIRDKSIS